MMTYSQAKKYRGIREKVGWHMGLERAGTIITESLCDDVLAGKA
ncbi:hypothetical protein [Thalassotalea hakodatensis]|nr:hypothetical protein [Thalassotalea hakodatensis]